ncbi:hypothetical protein A2685_02105 [Candidatus Woesebacteria bacterium RIFCSPHIGHO2_01_FULL_37_10]|uniref:Glycosyltransferase RgtA/B/C/D-like domain-containing protein n=1 Tax=Candidatus Woesebacteria bacterium RIFCSPHIGHO2_01_FULL_37_10 TaxID=1802489 RepID=A0A1F7XV23_9BACT|nr:MAG: hypothetical protein A2685_02105 [Candidatus Woesebacteria bacterium RIFCSPHIGHO2_01_FULL_37_10]
MQHIKLLLIVLCIAAFFYLYKLDINPPGLYADEASTGYNIYSILKTGKDEYGKLLPFGFRQMGSYTPPLYIYLSVPLMAIFGMSGFSTRLLSVICGMTIVALVFYLLQNLKICKSKTSLFFSTLFFAISPWLVFFSRVGYEQNLAFMLFTLLSVLFVKTLKNPKLFALLIPVVSVTTYADFPMRFLMPLIFITFGILFKSEIKVKKNLKYIAIGVVIASIIQLPNLYMSQTNSFFSKREHFYADIVLTQAAKIKYLPPIVSVPLAFVREFSAQYINYFSPRSLFFMGDPDPQRSIPEMGVLYQWTIIPYLFGLYLVYKSKEKLSRRIIITLLFITPLTGAFTHQPFHVQRTLAFLLPITLVISYAFDIFVRRFGSKLSNVAFTMLFLISVMFLWRGYFILLPQLRADTWAFQFKQLADFIRKNPQKHFVIDQYNLKPEDIAYFQLAFYLKINPEVLQSTSDPSIVRNYYNDVDFSYIREFSNIETKPIDWGEAVWKDEILVGDTASISDLEVKLHDLTKVLEVKSPNDQILLRGFQTNPVETNKNINSSKK